MLALGGLDDAFAFSHFTYHLAKAVAGMAAVLGGLDVLAFSGGIGENRADVREAVARRLRHLGEFRVEAVPAREEHRDRASRARAAGARLSCGELRSGDRRRHRCRSGRPRG